MGAALSARCARAVHVWRPDGGLLRAGRAILYIFHHLGWWWMWPLRLPLLIGLVELGYAALAANRPFFARFLFRAPADD